MNLTVPILIIAVVAIAISEATILDDSDDTQVENQFHKLSVHSKRVEPYLTRLRRSIRNRNRKRKIVPSDYPYINDGYYTRQNKRAIVAGGGMMYDVQPYLGPLPIGYGAGPGQALQNRGLGGLFGVLGR